MLCVLSNPFNVCLEIIDRSNPGPRPILYGFWAVDFGRLVRRDFVFLRLAGRSPSFSVQKRYFFPSYHCEMSLLLLHNCNSTLQLRTPSSHNLDGTKPLSKILLNILYPLRAPAVKNGRQNMARQLSLVPNTFSGECARSSLNFSRKRSLFLRKSCRFLRNK